MRVLIVVMLLTGGLCLAQEPMLESADLLPMSAESADSIAGVTTSYHSVLIDGDTRLRVLITRPEGQDAPLPPLLFTQWVSCGSIVYRAGSGSSEIHASLARHTGLSLVRVERSGSGDSTGLPCEELDYDTEVRHYQRAFEAVLASGLVDASRVFFFGSSLGSTTAPLIAHALQEQGFTIGGIAVQGGGAYSYLERMLAFEQNYLDRRPDAVSPEQRQSQYRDRVAFLLQYLGEGRHPDAIARDDPALAAVRADILGMDEQHHYGRPFAWHQQAAQRNFLSAWSAIEGPVLVLFNEFDQYESAYGAELLVTTVNRQRPGTATLIRQAGLGHSSYSYADIDSAYAQAGGHSGWSRTAGHLISWFAHQAR